MILNHGPNSKEKEEYVGMSRSISCIFGSDRMVETEKKQQMKAKKQKSHSLGTSCGPCILDEKIKEAPSGSLLQSWSLVSL